MFLIINKIVFIKKFIAKIKKINKIIIYKNAGKYPVNKLSPYLRIIKPENKLEKRKNRKIIGIIMLAVFLLPFL